MPFTPLHLGPGLAIKALAGDRFSLLAYGFAQLAMDLEPLLGLVFGFERLHGPTHTYAAALVIGLLVAGLTPPLGRPLLARWHRELVYHRQYWLMEPARWSAGPLLAGALVGTLSHVLLDSLMHADLTPFAPLGAGNPLLGLVSVETLTLGGLTAGALGAALWLADRWRARQAVG